MIADERRSHTLSSGHEQARHDEIVAAWGARGVAADKLVAGAFPCRAGVWRYRVLALQNLMEWSREENDAVLKGRPDIRATRFNGEISRKLDATNVRHEAMFERIPDDQADLLRDYLGWASKYIIRNTDSARDLMPSRDSHGYEYYTWWRTKKLKIFESQTRITPADMDAAKAVDTWIGVKVVGQMASAAVTALVYEELFTADERRRLSGPYERTFGSGTSH